MRLAYRRSDALPVIPTLPDRLISELQQRLLAWYAVNRRDLPWRGRSDPYEILVAEVMLQQTGVERVAAVYERFLAEFPGFAALAAARRQEVLRAWAGLGYNRRAVYLHECARVVVERHGGCLPSEPEALRRLPGLGPYTVAALLSFAFGRDVPAIDTNVRRVLGRLLSLAPRDERQLRAAAELLVPAGRSVDWNQALMDLGAVLCTAGQPRCSLCPLEDLCGWARGQPEVRRNGDRVSPVLQVAERPEPYLGSRRFLRGRIVAILRDLAPGTLLTIADLQARLAAAGAHVGIPHLAEIVRSLAAEGLATVHGDDRDVRVGPPD